MTRQSVNHLNKKARSQESYYDFVRMEIEKGERSGFSTKTKEELLESIKKKLLK